MKKAFTMIELIFVIVVLGIISLFTVNIYSNMYYNYIASRSIDKLESQSQILFDQIAMLLRDRVPNATIARGPGVRDVPVDSTTDAHRSLEWIGAYADGRYETDSWSGVMTGHNSLAAGSTVISPGSNFNGDYNSMGVIFKTFSAGSAVGWGWDGNSDKVMRISGASGNSFEAANVPAPLSPLYYVVNTAYAIVAEPTANPDVYELALYSGYQPWNSQARANRRVLADNVTMFRFRGNYGSIDMKICLRDLEMGSSKDENFQFIVCKAKVVL